VNQIDPAASETCKTRRSFRFPHSIIISQIVAPINPTGIPKTAPYLLAVIAPQSDQLEHGKSNTREIPSHKDREKPNTRTTLCSKADNLT